MGGSSAGDPRRSDRLPGRSREAIVLCYLQGRSQDDAAAALGLTKDGIKKRLERGREQLRCALLRRGLGPAAILAAAIAPLTRAPAALMNKTSELIITIGEGGIGSNNPDSIAPLIERGTTMFSTTKLLVSMMAFTALAVATISMPSFQPSATVTAAPRLPERNDDPKVVKTELDGTWKVVAISADGLDVGTDDFKGLKFAIRNAKLEVNESAKDKEVAWDPAYIRGSTVLLDGDASPKAIDLMLDPAIEKDTVVQGIYQIRDGKLKMAIRLLKSAKAKLPRPRGYVTNSGSIVTYTLKFVEEKAEGTR